MAELQSSALPIQEQLLQLQSAGSGNRNRQLQMVARDIASLQGDMWTCLRFMDISLPNLPSPKSSLALTSHLGQNV